MNPVTISCPVYLPPKPEKSPAADAAPVRKARFDSAQTGPENREHWAYADDLSANASALPDVRRVLRRRSRYERDNDPHVDGTVATLSDDMVGTGPRLQLNLGADHYQDARLVEKSFRAWCRTVGLAGKLRLMHEAKPTDGESFGQFITNNALANPVKLDLRLYETDQVETPGAGAFLAEALSKPNAVSGIEFDGDGNPAWYHVLRQHPGDTGYWNWVGDFDKIAARFILHWYRPRRAGQARGIPQLTSALPVSSQGRRFALATLGSAEYAASMNAILTSDAPPPDPDDPTEGTPDKDPKQDWAETRFTRNTLLMPPGGMQVTQLKAENPNAEYGEFMDRQHGTVGRSVRAPLNLVTGSSAQFNFASGRLDHLPYQRMVWIERDDFEIRIVDRIFLAWYQEAKLVGLIPDALPAVNEWEWEWHWDAFDQLDPLAETQATELKLQLNVTTLSEECAARGRDWREVLRQRAEELAYTKALEAEYGVTLTAATGALPAPPNPPPTDPAAAEDAANA